MSEVNELIEYDNHGRMYFNPLYHYKSGTPWTYEDECYLKEWYYIIGPEEMSFALERTAKSVMAKVAKLKKEGSIKTPLCRSNFSRIKKEPFGEGPKVKYQ